MSIANKVPTPIIDKNGKPTTVHKNPAMADIKSRIKNVAPTPAAVEDDSVVEPDRASLPIQEFVITRDNAAKFEHVIAKANARLERGGVVERFTYELTAGIKSNADGTNREVIYAILNKPVITNGDWTFTATHEFTPAGDVVSYWSQEGDFETPEDSHCDQCGKNRRRERVYTVSNSEGVTKQIGSNCLALFLGVRPEGLWTLNDSKIEDELADIESESLGGNSGITYSLRDIIGVALRETNNGERYVSRMAATKDNPATADVVSNSISARDSVFDEVAIDSVLDFVRSADNDGSDYMDNLKTVFGNGADEEQVYVKQRHLGIAASAVSAWYRDSHKPERNPDRVPANAEYIGQPKERIKTPTSYRVDRRFSYETDYGTTIGYVLRDKDDHVLLWKSTSDSPPDVWEGGTVELSAFTVKEHGIDSYTGDHQTVIQRAVVGGVEDLGKAPAWKVEQVVMDEINKLSPEQRQNKLNEYYDIEGFSERKAFATEISGVVFS